MNQSVQLASKEVLLCRPLSRAINAARLRDLCTKVRQIAMLSIVVGLQI